MEGRTESAGGVSRERTLAFVLKRGRDFLEGAGVPESDINAWILFSHCFHMERSSYFLRRGEPADPGCRLAYKKCLEKRAERVPLEYITNSTEFMGLPFYVDKRVLVPRQDTECLVEEALTKSGGRSVLDLCTGSGCIGISMAVLGKCEAVMLSDISPEALAVAQRNADENKVDAAIVKSDLFSDISGSFGLIVSNPPYIPSGDIPRLMPEVGVYEPRLALDGSPDGLAFYRRIAKEAPGHLHSGGWLMFETGCDQGGMVRGIMEQAGFRDVQVKKDLAGLDRVVAGRIV